MKFDEKLFYETLKHQFQTSRGWSEDMARDASAQAVFALQKTHGGANYYIQKPKTNRDLIRREHKAGLTVARLANRHHLTVRTIRRIVYGN